MKFHAFGVVDWRKGARSFGFSSRRDAESSYRQLDDPVARSSARGRMAIVLTDNAGTHRPDGSSLVREALARHRTKLRLVYPAYDAQGNRIEGRLQFWRRRASHIYNRGDMFALACDPEAEVGRLQDYPAMLLQVIGSPGCSSLQTALGKAV